MEGYNVACPYLMVNDVEKELNFIENVFGGEVMDRVFHPEGNLIHGEARIRDSVIMIGKSKRGFPSMEAMIYVFRKDVKQTYLTALENGAESLSKPHETFYGMKEAGVKDQQGVQWWISEIIEKLSREEMQKRLLEQTQSRTS